MSSDSIPERRCVKALFNLVRDEWDERLAHPLKRRYF